MSLLTDRPNNSYHALLDALGCLTQRYRGSGFKTALAAAALAHLHCDDETPAEALVAAANELESDTDTIATMAGAILGCVCKYPPDWDIQDREYLIREASRLAAISDGRAQDSFTYPDLGRWNPPTSQTASVSRSQDGLAIAGLGLLDAIGPEYQAGDAVWQWFALPFGQSILAKRKADLRTVMPSSQLPGPRQQSRPSAGRAPAQLVRGTYAAQAGLALESTVPAPVAEQRATQERRDDTRRRDNLDGWTAAVIQSDFDDLTLGQLLNRCIDMNGTIESAAAFAGIIAKAKLSRQRRRR